MVDTVDLAAIDALQIKYVSALDSRDMQRWLECFDGDGSYICISAENAEQGLPLALMMDDCYDRLRDRVNYVTKVWAGTYEDYATRHFVQRLSCRADGGIYLSDFNFMVVYTSAQGASEVLVSGRYQDQVVVDRGVAKFRSKKAVLDTVVVPRYLVYPL